MPVTNLIKQSYPKWAEVNYYDIINFNTGEVFSHEKKSKKEMIFVGNGTTELTYRYGNIILERGNHFNLIDHDISFKAFSDITTIIIIGGNWNEVMGSYGVFEMSNSNNPSNIGDQTKYERKTKFDNHFHDCDEYWIIYEGSGEVVTESNHYTIKEGNCVITKMGDHHDIINIYKTLKGVYFETSLKGKKRLGHLWNHTHN